MAPFSELSEGAYDEAATQITYCKLFSLMAEDFLLRVDSKFMMLPSNLLASCPPPSFTGSVQTIYKGGTKSPLAAAVIAQKKAIQQAGGVALDNALNTALGG